MKIILPGQTIGIIGGGQLGRMLAMSAKEMGYKIAILDPSKEACARHFADTFIHADFDNRKGLERLCQISDVVTFEFENIDSDLLTELEKDYHIVQSASLLKTAFPRHRNGGLPVCGSRYDWRPSRRHLSHEDGALWL